MIILSAITIVAGACSIVFSIRTRRLLRQAKRNLDDLAATPQPIIPMRGVLTPEAAAELRRRFREEIRRSPGGMH